MTGEMEHIWRHLGTFSSFPLHLACWDLQSSRIMKQQLPRVRSVSPLSVQENIWPQQEFCPSEESYPSTARSLSVKAGIPQPGISQTTPALELQQVWCFQKSACTVHSWSTNIRVLCRETDAPRVLQTCSPPPARDRAVRAQRVPTSLVCL